MELKFRTLRADEIECRVGQVFKDKGFSLLLYKNARVDMALLDEQVGVGKWQREHKILGDDIYCRVGIWNDELKQFVWYEDAGSSGGIEKEKSKASDSFKRACVNVGIGRELYSAPFIYIPITEDNKKEGVDYSVKEIAYNNKREINKLTIVNDKTGEIVYSYPKNAKVSQNVPKEPKTSVNDLIDNSLQHEDTITQEDLNTIEAYLLTIKGNDMKTHAFNEYLINTFNVYSAKNLNFADGRKVAEFCRKKLANGK